MITGFGLIGRIARARRSALLCLLRPSPLAKHSTERKLIMPSNDCRHVAVPGLSVTVRITPLWKPVCEFLDSLLRINRSDPPDFAMYCRSSFGDYVAAYLAGNR